MCITDTQFRYGSVSEIILTRNPKVIWEESRRHPEWQRMDSPTACASCTMPTADEANHSAASTLHSHHTDGHTTMAYTALAYHYAVKIHQI